MTLSGLECDFSEIFNDMKHCMILFRNSEENGQEAQQLSQRVSAIAAELLVRFPHYCGIGNFRLISISHTVTGQFLRNSAK